MPATTDPPSGDLPRVSPWVVVALWTVPAALSTFETVMFARGGGQSISVVRVFASEAPGWYTWAALTPLIIRLGQRFPLDRRPRPGALVVHATASLIASAPAIDGATDRADDSPPADSFAVSDSVRAEFAANAAQTTRNFRLGATGAPTELADGIVRVPDFWTMTLVRQDDGIVIFEAHISASYLREVAAEAKRRFPGLPIKALVMTSDPWAHIGGVREAVAMGIPIYINARSIPFLTKLAHTPHTLEPDALARSPHAPQLVPVSGKVVIGGGANRIELYPVGGPYAERMTMAYFPERRLLYEADLVFPADSGKGFDRTPATD
jgi:glyoxylase-like metal-dependent hydrolase (beta-lactamase superfamily II)